MKIFLADKLLTLFLDLDKAIDLRNLFVDLSFYFHFDFYYWINNEKKAWD